MDIRQIRPRLRCWKSYMVKINYIKYYKEIGEFTVNTIMHYENQIIKTKNHKYVYCILGFNVKQLL